MNYIPAGIADRNKPAGLNSYVISAPGIRARHDSRDNILSSRTGSYVDVFYSFFRPGLGSQYNFSMSGLDARKFINLTPTPKKYNILAFNFVLNKTLDKERSIKLGKRWAVFTCFKQVVFFY